jgi:hypothetical protein
MVMAKRILSIGEIWESSYGFLQEMDLSIVWHITFVPMGPRHMVCVTTLITIPRFDSLTSMAMAGLTFAIGLTQESGAIWQIDRVGI